MKIPNLNPLYRNSLFTFALLALCACGAATDAPSAATSDDAATDIGRAAIAIPDPYAAQIAEDILQNGGNAVDAAVATTNDFT